MPTRIPGMILTCQGLSPPAVRSTQKNTWCTDPFTIPYFYNIKYIKVRFSSTHHQRTCKVFSSQDSQESCGYRLELAQNQLNSWLPIQNHWKKGICRPFWTNRSSPVRCGEVIEIVDHFPRGFPMGKTHDSGSGRRRRSGSRYRRWSPPSEQLRAAEGEVPSGCCSEWTPNISYERERYVCNYVYILYYRFESPTAQRI